MFQLWLFKLTQKVAINPYKVYGHIQEEKGRGCYVQFHVLVIVWNFGDVISCS